MVRLLGCFVENWMQICRAGAPINLSQHSFCRWLPQHKINCSYIHLQDFQAFRIKSKGGIFQISVRESSWPPLTELLMYAQVRSALSPNWLQLE